MRKILYLLIAVMLFPAIAFSADYFWVGGAGNWSDINHWRTTSGGSTIPNVVPGPTDDVYFDANSGFTTTSKIVTLNVAANCRNITFDGSSVPPTISGGSSVSLNIYGSSVWQAGMVNNAYYIYYQNNGTPKTIKTNGVKFSTYTYLLETTSVDLLDDADLGTYFYVNAGTFNTNDHTLTVSSFYANQTTGGSGPRTLNLGSSDIYVTSTYFNTNSSQCTVNAGTSHIHLTGTLNSGSYGLVGYNGQNFNNVTFENEASTTAGIQGDLNINRVEFKGGGYIGGNSKINEVIFSPGKLYQIVAGKTLTVNNKLSGGAHCSGWMTIRSVTDGSKATISMSAGATVDVNGAVIRDIAATGGASFVANNSVDDGGNTGWSFPASTGIDLYWVGGAGDWGDTAHWSLTSGGAGGACVPGPSDNVFFDANSGFTSASQKVNLDGVSYCKDITFSGSPVAPEVSSSTSNNSLNIYGSSVWQSGMTYNVYNTYYHDTEEDKTITSNGVTTSQYVILKETKSISLLDNFLGNSITLETGTFNTNDHDVTLSYYLQAYTSKPKTLNLGSSNIYMTGTSSYIYTQNAQTTVNAGTSHIHFTGAISNSYGLTALAGQTFYNLSVDNPITSNAVITVSSGTAASANLNFNKVDLKGGVTFTGNMKMEELSLAAGKVYSFNENRTITVNQKLTAGTVCEGWTVMKSRTAGSVATIWMPSTATLDVQGVLMSDIAGTGGVSFIANGSVDQGNNPGWTFNGGAVKDLYWVGGAGLWTDPSHWALTTGGAGGACVPGPGDNVFFDVNSGFTSASRIVTVEGNVFCRDITVTGAATPPTIQSANNNNNILNIYGSSTWQTGQPSVTVYVINYQNTGEDKTITSNGVTTGPAQGQLGSVNFYETATISITDPLKIGCQLYQYAGTFNTNNFRVDIGRNFYSTSGTARVLNLGKSDIYMSYGSSVFNTSSNSVTVNAGTSHIHFTGSITSTGTGLRAYNGQAYHNVSFESASATMGEIYSNGTLTINRAEFRGGGRLMGNNTFNELILLSNKTYQLEANKTQTVNVNLTMSGTPCDVLPIRSVTSGTRANLNVLAGTTNFNFVNIKDINASGLALHFGAQSTVAGQNNNNVTYDPYDPGAIEGLGADLTCQVFRDDDPASYTLTAAGFYGNEYTQYSWKKVGNNTVIGTGSTLDIRPYGYGTYTVDVAYTNGLTVTCRVSDDIVVNMTPSMTVASPYNVCIKGQSTLISDVTGLTGQDIKWYATSSSITPLPSTTVLVDGQTYYVTQTIDGCESVPVELTVKLINCNNKVYINPNLRLRVSY